MCVVGVMVGVGMVGRFQIRDCLVLGRREWSHPWRIFGSDLCGFNPSLENEGTET